MTKLKLGPLPDDKPVKVTVELPAPLHRDLAAYAEVLARETGRRREETLLRCSLADVDLLEGELAHALARFTEAHALAMRTDVGSSIAVATVGALWAAVLKGEVAVAQA